MHCNGCRLGCRTTYPTWLPQHEVQGKRSKRRTYTPCRSPGRVALFVAKLSDQGLRVCGVSSVKFRNDGFERRLHVIEGAGTAVLPKELRWILTNLHASKYLLYLGNPAIIVC